MRTMQYFGYFATVTAVIFAAVVNSASVLIENDANQTVSNFETSDVAGRHHHDCLHDHIMEAVGWHDHHRRTRARQLYTKKPLKSNNLNGNLSMPKPKTTFVEDITPVEDGYIATMQRQLSGSSNSYEKMRIKIDTSRVDDLMSDVGQDGVPLTCTFNGQLIRLTQTSSSTTRYTCTANDVLTPTERVYLKSTILEEAILWLHNALSVIPVSGNLILDSPMSDYQCFNNNWGIWNSFMCCDSLTPTSDKTTGVSNTDFVLYVTTRPTTGSTLAWALTCQSDQYGRPIAGHANFSPARLSTSPSDKQAQLATAIHELSHALGFSSSKFPDFRKPNSDLREDYSNIVGTFTENGKTVKRIITPTVVENVKSQFDCTNWPNAGGELEDYGGSGTAGSHWEKRVFNNEYMTGTSDPNSVYSAVTLALFQDSGWYKVDFSMAEKLPWGLGEGCSFARDACSSRSNRYFCSTQNQAGCTADMRYRGYCNKMQYSYTLPSEYQYFSNPEEGGSNAYMDYCPYFARYSNGDCKSSSTNAYWWYGETTGSDSLCFTGNWKHVLSSVTQNRHSSCLQASCDDTTNLLIIRLSGTSSDLTVHCPAAGGNVDLSTLSNSEFTGTLTCPRSDLVCTGDPCDTNTCSGHGICNSNDGTCTCPYPYYGQTIYDCDLSHCPNYNATTNTECSGHGTCDSNTGECSCDSGWSDIDCSFLGCAVGRGNCTGGSNARCECSGQGSCISGSCVCTSEHWGEACDLLECPIEPVSQLHCAGTEKGSCNGNYGICECHDNVYDEEGQKVFYDGIDCNNTNYGDRQRVSLHYLGEPIPNDPSDTLDSGRIDTIQALNTNYYQFDVMTTQYPITLRVTLTNGSSASSASEMPRILASYATNPTPYLSTAQFSNNAYFIDGTDSYMTLVLEKGLDNGTASFDRTGLMYVTVLSISSSQTYNLTVERDGCALISCAHGAICSGGSCNCPRWPEPSNPSRTYGYSGLSCDIADCPASPDCGGSRGTCTDRPLNDPNPPYCTCQATFDGAACDQYAVDNTTVVPGATYGATSKANLTVVLDTPRAEVSGVDESASVSANSTVVRTTLVIHSEGICERGKDENVLLIDPVLLASAYGMNDTTSRSIYVRINASRTPRADPMLLANPNRRPTLLEYSEFDVGSWADDLEIHEFRTLLPNDLYFVNVFNGMYGQDRLNYSLYAEISDGCPPALNDCSNHGICARSTKQCVCDSGWEGIRCDIRVPELNDNETVSTDNLLPGEWTYYLFRIPENTAEISVQSYPTKGSVRSQPLMVAAFDNSRKGTSLSRLRTEFAKFDYDGYSATVRSSASNLTSNVETNNQTIQARNQTIILHRNSPSSEKLLYIGLQNTPSGSAPVTMKLIVQTSTTSSLPTSCDASDTVCSQTYCHSRGSYSFSNGKPYCNCEFGWSSDTNCGSPRFASFSNMAAAAQSLNFICSRCVRRLNLTRDALQIYRVPQPLQAHIGLKLVVDGQPTESPVNSTGRRLNEMMDFSATEPFDSTIHQMTHVEYMPTVARMLNLNMLRQSRELETSSSSKSGNPSLLVSQVLPRSMSDFAYIASSSAGNESLVLRSRSNTGSYFVIVYANTEGEFELTSSRVQLYDPPEYNQNLVDAVLDWLLHTSAGQTFLIIACVLVGLILLCCIANLACARRCRKQLEEAELKRQMELREWHKAQRSASVADSILVDEHEENLDGIGMMHRSEHTPSIRDLSSTTSRPRLVSGSDNSDLKQFRASARHLRINPTQASPHKTSSYVAQSPGFTHNPLPSRSHRIGMLQTDPSLASVPVHDMPASAVPPPPEH